MPVLDNPRHEVFAREIAKGCSATEAYVKAGYKKDDANAFRLTGNDRIQARIKEFQERAAELCGLTQAKVLAEMMKMGFSNMMDYMTVGKDGLPFIDWKALNRDQAAAIVEVTVEEKTATEYDPETESKVPVPIRKVRFKLANKQQALEKLGLEVGLFKEKSERDLRVSFLSEAVRNSYLPGELDDVPLNTGVQH